MLLRIKMKRKNKHLNTRLFRIQAPISKHDIKRAIDRNDYKSIKKVSVARRLAYVTIDKYIIKIIMDRNTKDIITIIPMNYQYKKEYKILLNENLYKLTLFPDCYIETSDCRMLTSLHVFDNKLCEWELIKLKGKIFQSLFNICWYCYNKNEDYPYEPINGKEIIEKIKTSNN